MLGMPEEVDPRDPKLVEVRCRASSLFDGGGSYTGENGPYDEERRFT